ncbi:class I SAM-dependent methyltransferase [Methylococcus sp. EFPC2]|uniref:class I SAM-dependent DNA methyltransferase n=1 Tax=Methylococcus sp. EFPC2 TaxID=2812648 RepID=UPI0019678B1A|nr:class I SAM-dependent methyltransferase [Methylococcus sp. EFPC2]QSA96837.1 methyltransferase domain-containing protein [Methylococcus sp. EFPC2]
MTETTTGSVFDAYSVYYDLLYRDKDYSGEAGYVSGLIQQHLPNAKRILELGCGTGGHARELAKLGYRITGLDRSPSMIQRARKRASDTPLLADIDFVIGDLRDFRTDTQFDVVLALFHVISYQTSNDDLLAAMTTAAEHLHPGGVFIFDCWYGPGVLTDPPVTRVRRLEGDGVTVTRIAEPVVYPNDNRVDVHYEVLVEGERGLSRITEIHAMRYLFAPEVGVFLQAAGLSPLRLLKWLDESEPDVATWNACFVAVR